MNGDDLKTGWRSKYEYDLPDPYDMHCPKLNGKPGTMNFYKKSCERKKQDPNIKECSDKCSGLNVKYITHNQLLNMPRKYALVKEMILSRATRKAVIEKTLISKATHHLVTKALYDSGELLRTSKVRKDKKC